MTKSLSLVMLSFAVFGCATLSDSPKTLTAASPGAQITGAKLDNAGDSDRKQISSATFSAEEVRQVQTLLRTVV
jgi:hypothetical protein